MTEVAVGLQPTTVDLIETIVVILLIVAAKIPVDLAMIVAVDFSSDLLRPQVVPHQIP